MSGKQENLIVNAINLFRTTPAEASTEIENTMDKMHNLDNNQRIKMSAFGKSIQGNSPINSLKKSICLNELCAERMNLILNKKTETEKELNKRINTHVVGYTEIKEIYHQGRLTDFFYFFMNSEHDPNRDNRVHIFDSFYNYIGINIELLEDNPDEFHMCICIVDKVLEENKKSLDLQIVDAINVFRQAPSRKSEELLDIKGSEEFNKSIEELVEKFTYLTNLQKLERSECIDDVAKNVYEKITAKELKDLSDESLIFEIANNTVHNFTRMHCYHVKNIYTTKDVINQCLANTKENLSVLTNSRKLLYGRNMKFIGIHFEGEGEKNNSMTLVTCDEFYKGSKKEFSEYFTEQLNRFRNKPESYQSDLTVYNNEIKIKTYKSKLIKNINNLKNSLTGKEELPKIENHPVLDKVCKDYFNHYYNNNLYPEESEMLLKRLSMHISGHTKAECFIEKEIFRPENFITKCLISENDPEFKGRKALMSDEYKYFGCYYNYIKNKKYILMILVDDVLPRPVLSAKDELFEVINLFRVNPRSFIKYIYEYKADLKEKLTSKKQSTIGKKKKTGNLAKEIQAIEDKIHFCHDVKNFLCTAKLRPQLKQSNQLDSALNKTLKQNDPNLDLQEHELREYLKQFINNHYFCSMIAGVIEPDFYEEENNKNYFNAGRFIAKRIIEECNFDILKILNSSNLKFMATGEHLENEILLVYFVDQCIERVKVEVPLCIKLQTKRPNFTEDELEQLRNDFNRLDILNELHIRPDTILTFINNSHRFVYNNPIYYAAFRNLNTIENNQLGINVNQFMDEISNVISSYSKENWRNIYHLILSESNVKKFDKKFFKKTLDKINHQMSESEAYDVFERFAGDADEISKSEFVKMMLLCEKGEFYCENEPNDS